MYSQTWFLIASYQKSTLQVACRQYRMKKERGKAILMENKSRKIKQKFKQKKMRLRQMRQQKLKNTGKGITRNMEKKLVQSQK